MRRLTFDVPPTARALAVAARLAGYAPSVHNTQPWRWRIAGDAMGLHADFGRQLVASDPRGRLLAISCGAALFEARTALAAAGWRVTVERTNGDRHGDLLARIVITGRTKPTREAADLIRLVEKRHTDRRPVADRTVTAEALASLRTVVEAEGASLHILRPDDVVELAVTAERAQTLEMSDPYLREEIAYWAGGAPEGLGIPDSARLNRPAETTVPGRDFGSPGSLPVSAGSDKAAVYAILFADADAPPAWLRAGEALCAAWLRATGLGLTLLPFSAAIEVEPTRQVLRRLLSGLGEPMLVLRLGFPRPDNPDLGTTARLPSEQTVEIVDDTGSTQWSG